MNPIQIGNLSLGLKPEIVLAVGDYSQKQSKAHNHGASILEARIDRFSKTDWSHVKNQLKKHKQQGMPLIGTIRSKKERGEWTQSEEERKKLFLEILNTVDAIDIELDSDTINGSVARACQKAKKTLIVSSHDFNGTPSDQKLADLTTQGKGLGADIVKIACLAKQQSDVVRMLEFVQANKEKGLIGISMGPLGSISRVVGHLFGSLLTYTSLNPTLGQLSLADLAKISGILYPKVSSGIRNFTKTSR